MKVSELIRAELDYWVAKAEGLPLSAEWNTSRHGGIMVGTGQGDLGRFAPSTDGAQGDPIIDREFIATEYEGRETWLGRIDMGQKSLSTQLYTMPGPTRLVAAMRVYVASKFGDEVPE